MTSRKTPIGRIALKRRSATNELADAAEALAKAARRGHDPVRLTEDDDCRFCNAARCVVALLRKLGMLLP